MDLLNTWSLDGRKGFSERNGVLLGTPARARNRS